MTMDISNQNKLGEFHEELKRINIKVIRPDINKCFADFQFDDNNFIMHLVELKVLAMKQYQMLLKKEIKMEILNL